MINSNILIKCGIEKGKKITPTKMLKVFCFGYALAGNQLINQMLKFWKILVVTAYLIGFYLLFHSAFFEEDPMLKMNRQAQHILEELIQTKYFRIIRLNIDQGCPLGIQNRICKSNSCTVCRCNEQDIPFFWEKTDRVKSHSKGQDLWSKEREADKEWVWHVEDESNDQGEYFDVYSNIESFTNYNGTSIWQLIYGQNCFKSSYEQMCEDEQIFFNIISGLHTSISTHLSKFYKNVTTQNIWADLNKDGHAQFYFNYSQYQRRVLDHPNRIKNLFFIYRILAKAIKQAGPFLLNNMNIQSDNATEDLRSKNLLDGLLRGLQEYDLSVQEKESLKFFKQGNPKVREYQKYIHNISNILNCVECQKCRLFGKMQTYGVGTALKILLGYPTPYKRNEIVALFNVFNKVSMSVDTYYRHRKEIIKIGYEKQMDRWITPYAYFGVSLGFALLILTKWKESTLGKQKDQ